jgi:hypothetical protein
MRKAGQRSKTLYQVLNLPGTRHSMPVSKQNGGKKGGNGKEETLHGTKHNIHICVF